MTGSAALADTPPKVRTFVRLAWASTFGAVRRAPLIFVGSLVALTIVGVADSLATAALDKVEASGWLLKTGQTIAGMAAWLATMILTSLALAPVAIAVHRLVILGELPTGAACFGNTRWRRFAAWLLGFQVFYALCLLPKALYGAAGTFALVAFAAVATGVLTLRSSLLFPAVATDVPGGSIKERVELSWARTEGVSLRMIFVLLIAELPFLLLDAIAVLRGGSTTPSATDSGFHLFGAAGALFSAAADVGGIAIGAAVASWFYLWVLDHPR